MSPYRRKNGAAYFRPVCRNWRRHVIPMPMVWIGRSHNPATGEPQDIFACSHPRCDFRAGFGRDPITGAPRCHWRGLHVGRHAAK